MSSASGDAARCFVVVLARRDPGDRATASRKPLSLSSNTTSIAAFRRCAMAATRQITERLTANHLPYELLAVDPESSDPRDQPPSPHAWHVLKAMIDTDPWWLAARGRLSGTLDAGRLAAQARRDAQGALASSDNLIVLTNHELAPARDATYQLWSVDRDKRHAVISASVIDPYQQSGPTDDRFEVIGRRLRSAICAALGQLIGISRCDNDECYMLDGDISVGDLDHMTGFGSEHQGERLVGLGFASESEDRG